jgi:hypothetical protein
VRNIHAKTHLGRGRHSAENRPKRTGTGQWLKCAGNRWSLLTLNIFFQEKADFFYGVEGGLEIALWLLT